LAVKLQKTGENIYYMQGAMTAGSGLETPIREERSLLPKINFAFSSLEKTLSPKLQVLSASSQWKNWQWQMKNRIRSVDKLREYFPSLEEGADLVTASEKFPLAITPYYASLIRKLDDTDPVFMMSMPQIKELWSPPFLREDPLEEERDMPVPGLVHRYPDRVLLIATSVCAMYCRYCTRKRVTGMRESCISESRIKRTVEYLQAHPEIKDVVVSGGDPLTMPTSVLESILAALRSVRSIDVIRIGTKTPVTMPMRITDELVTMLRKYHTLWINTHFNHPNELTPEAAEACAKLVDAGIPVGNQSVLLKGINDNPSTMEELLRGLVRMRVRPYYLFQCDLVEGIEHFRTPLARGIEIMERLRGRLSGIAIPNFVVDMPHGGGKVPVLPNYVVSTSPTHTVLRNAHGMLVSYPEPYAEDKVPEKIQPFDGYPSVWDLANGHVSKIQPENMDRQVRRGKAYPIHDQV
jgi:lysine 2,3-aminomutase